MARTVERTAWYSSVAIAFHWTIALLIVVNLILGLFHDAMPKGWQAMPLHKAIGITVLILSIGRLAWRIGHRPPPLPASLPGWERTTAHAVHWIFYVLMIALPLTGWMMVSGATTLRPLTWFGLFPIPFLPVSKAAGGFGHEAHELMGFLFAALVVIHILAALRHHILLRDSTLVRMLPIARVSNH